MQFRNVLVVVGAFALSLVATSEVEAVPSLGVGSSYGYINATDPYQFYWGGPSLKAGAGEDGYAIGPSGSKLHVFTNILNADIYILTTSNVGLANNIAFNGSINVYDNTEVFSSYSPIPYYGINLGKAPGDTWAALPVNPFEPGPFYSKDVTVDYSGMIGFDSWIFAAADTNGLAGLQGKATSAWTETNGLEGIQEKESTEWHETNGKTGIQEVETTEWVDDNGLADIQKVDQIVWVNDKGDISTVKTNTHRNPKSIKADTSVFYRADTLKTYAADTVVIYTADTFSKYQSDDSSPKTTAARGGYEFPEYPAVPEPSTVLLLGTGLAALIVGRKKISKQ